MEAFSTLTLDRPDKRNALSASLIEALSDALQRADLDADIRVVVLRGAGKDFCAGADLAELLESADHTLAENEATHACSALVFEQIRNLPKPVVAVVQGGPLPAGQVWRRPAT